MSDFSHTLKGVIIFNLPVTFFLATVFHLLVRDEIIKFLPAFLQRRALAVRPLDWFAYLKRNWFIFIYSAIIGAVSHIFWDDFTNFNGYFQRFFPVLNESILIEGNTFVVARLIQHISTVVGGLIILLYVMRLKSITVIHSITPAQKLLFWTAIPVLAGGFLILSLAADLTTEYLKSVIITYLSGMLLATILVSFVVKKQWV